MEDAEREQIKRVEKRKLDKVNRRYNVTVLLIISVHE